MGLDGSMGIPRGGVSLVDAVQALTGQAIQQGGTIGPMRELPRNPLDQVPFGPLWPLQPQAIDPARADSGRPEPRVWEYPQGFNLPGSTGRLIPFEVLRAAASDVDIIRRCIEVRKEDVHRLKWTWKVSEEAIAEAIGDDTTKDKADVEAELRKKFSADIARLTTFWKAPWRTNGATFKQWVNAVMEDHIALDAVAVYPVESRGGDVIAFRLIDGSTIKPLLNEYAERPAPPYPAFQQELYGFPRGDFLADIVLDEQGREITTPGFTSSQLTYYRENLRTYSPYGLSAVEQALISAALYLKRQGWMHAEYDEGSTPLTWLVPDGDKFVAGQLMPAQRREYERALNDDLGGQTGKRHRVKMSYPGYTPVQMTTEAEQYKPDYDLFMVRMVAGHLSVTLDRLGFTESKGLGATGQHERQAEVQDDGGVNADAAMLAELVNGLSLNYLQAPPELVFEFYDSKTKSEVEADAVAAAQRLRGTLTLNEDRRRVGKPTFDLPEADMPALTTPTGMIYIEGGADQQAAMNTLAANPPAPPLPGAGGGRAPGPSGGTGVRPKPSGPKPSGPKPQVTKAVSDEIVAYHRWLRKQAGRTPARPFRFESTAPAQFSGEHDGALQDFTAAGYEWVAEIHKGTVVDWNAANPLHPRGPNGRFILRGSIGTSLIDAIKDEQRATRRMTDFHESALDEAVRRHSAGRPVRRGEAGLTDDLEQMGLLEEHGGAGKNKNRLELSDAGRAHLVARNPEAYAAPAAPAESTLDRGRRVSAVAEAVSEIEGLANDSGELDVIRRRVAATARRNAKDADLAGLASSIEQADDLDEVRRVAREFAEQHGLTRVGDAGQDVPFNPKLHDAIGERPKPGSSVQVIRPGYTIQDDSALTRRLHGGTTLPVRKATVEPSTDLRGRAALRRMNAEGVPPETDGVVEGEVVPDAVPEVDVKTKMREAAAARRAARQAPAVNATVVPEPTGHGQVTEASHTIEPMTTPDFAYRPVKLTRAQGNALASAGPNGVLQSASGQTIGVLERHGLVDSSSGMPRITPLGRQQVEAVRAAKAQRLANVEPPIPIAPELVQASREAVFGTREPILTPRADTSLRQQRIADEADRVYAAGRADATPVSSQDVVLANLSSPQGAAPASRTDQLRAALASASSRGAGHAAIAHLKATELKELARDLGVPDTGRKADVAERIVDHFVGKPDSSGLERLMGGPLPERLRGGPISAPAPTEPRAPKPRVKRSKTDEGLTTEGLERLMGGPLKRGEFGTMEDARGQGAADRLRQAEIMYGSDRSQWPARERRAAEKLEQSTAAPKPAPSADERIAHMAAMGGSRKGSGDFRGYFESVSDAEVADLARHIGSRARTPKTQREAVKRHILGIQAGRARAQQSATSARATAREAADVPRGRHGVGSPDIEAPTPAPSALEDLSSLSVTDFMARVDAARKVLPQSGPERKARQADRGAVYAERDRRVAAGRAVASGMVDELKRKLSGDMRSPETVEWDRAAAERVAARGDEVAARKRLRAAGKPITVDSLRAEMAAPAPSADERQLAIQTENYQALLARAEALDIDINFADDDTERARLERARDQVGEQMAALDRQIEAARRRTKRKGK